MGDNAKEGIRAIVEGALTVAVAESVKARIREQVPEIIATTVAEATKSAVGALVGPVLKTLLAIADRNKFLLEKLVREPLATGSREALEALEVDPQTQSDRAALVERLVLADAKLAQAWTLLDGKGSDHTKFLIKLLRGLIMNRRGAFTLAARDLSYCYDVIGVRLRQLTRTLRGVQKGYATDITSLEDELFVDTNLQDYGYPPKPRNLANMFTAGVNRQLSPKVDSVLKEIVRCRQMRSFLRLASLDEDGVDYGHAFEDLRFQLSMRYDEAY